MKTLTKQNAVDILVWYFTEGQGNWGGWGKYPSLPVGASYQQYESNPVQINFTEIVSIGEANFNCISKKRSVGQKYSSYITFSFLQEYFGIASAEIQAVIEAKETSEQKKLVQRWLSHAEKMLINDDYAPFTGSIEQIFIKSERESANYNAPIGRVIFANAPGNELFFGDMVEWHLIRTQGKNGPNKKKVFAPVAIPSHIADKIQLHLEVLKADRIASLKKDIEKYTAQLA